MGSREEIEYVNLIEDIDQLSFDCNNPDPSEYFINNRNSTSKIKNENEEKKEILNIDLSNYTSNSNYESNYTSNRNVEKYIRYTKEKCNIDDEEFEIFSNRVEGDEAEILPYDYL